MIKSFKKNGKGIMLMLISALFACFGQLLWKMSSCNGVIFLLVGFILYGIGALLMLVAYRYGKVSILQPVLSTSYVISLFLAVIVLNETLSVKKLVGVIVIVLGVVFVAGGDEIDSCN